jgi:hypothetical protein
MGFVPNFQPSANGLNYSNNNWPNVPDLTLSTPFGNIPIGSASNGLCGGMAFSVRDLFEAHLLPPVTTANPDSGSPAFNYIVQRLFDSFNLPTGVAEYYTWMNLPSHDTLIASGTSHLTIESTMPTVRDTIDSGHPCPLGLVCIESTNPEDLGQNHQVLAYGYQDEGSMTTVFVYDCNWPDDDNVTISFDHTDPDHTTAFNYSTGDHNVRGFFATPYTASNPSDLFEDGNTPPPGWQSPAVEAVLTGEVTFVFQPFPDVDAVQFSAYYATNPTDITTVAWHQLPAGTRQSDGTFTASWDSASIPDQGNAGWGTVNVAAGSSKQGTPVNPTCYRLFSTKNGVAPPTPQKELVCGYSPRPLPLNQNVSVEFTAHDEQTGAVVVGTVTITTDGRVQATSRTGRAFTHDFQPTTIVIPNPHALHPEERTIYPIATVTAPGYPANQITLEFSGA